VEVAAISWEETSRELELTCDTAGTIVWLDARASRRLGCRAGDDFIASVVPGTEDKARALLDRARKESVRDFELPLVADAKPSTVSFSGRPGPDGRIHLHGLVMPDGYGEAVRELRGTMQEILELNRAVARQEKELREQHDALARAFRELDESNRGVLTLHAELADKADSLTHTADVRARIVANVSHEFRTPVHTILGLSQLLLDGTDGMLGEEQKKQVRFIRTSAEELSTLVNDLLDLSKAESGSVILRPERFSASDFFSALRGQLRPLLVSKEVELVFEDPAPDFILETDHGKLAQIARNLVSNALKFTERGEVRVSIHETGGIAELSVKDTGIGVAPENHAKIFEEFGQIDNPIQTRVKGTGLGLPLSQKLAQLLGGSLAVDSALGRGSTFTLAIPTAHPEVREFARIESEPLDPSKTHVLVVEDDRKTIFLYHKYLSMAGFQVIPARNTEDARELLRDVRPSAIVLDIMLEGEASWSFLAELKREPKTRDIPVLVVTVTNKEHKARALGADEFWLKPVDQDQLLRKLKALSKPSTPAKVLVIDDDERARYLLRKFLEPSPYQLLEAGSGTEGLRRAQEERPDVILLDFLLDEMAAFDVLDDLKADARTRGIPVVIVTSHLLASEERARLAAETEAILSKESLSRELAINRIRDALQKAGVGEHRPRP
jgi:signal transduction histidine kinase/CheY-like chemotaxis protein